MKPASATESLSHWQMKQSGMTVVGEMGTGKTFIAAAAHLAGFRREVEQTIPGVRAAVISRITDLERLRTLSGAEPLFAVMVIMLTFLESYGYSFQAGLRQ